MIQLLINTDVNLTPIQEEFGFQLTRVTEMIDNTYLILINDKDDFDAIELAIEEVGDVDIVGSYNMDGTQFQWINPNSNRNHSITKYTGKLKPKQVWNETTEQYDEVPYNETTALDKQINLIYGYPQRQLA